MDGQRRPFLRGTVRPRGAGSGKRHDDAPDRPARLYAALPLREPSSGLHPECHRRPGQAAAAAPPLPRAGLHHHRSGAGKRRHHRRLHLPGRSRDLQDPLLQRERPLFGGRRHPPLDQGPQGHPSLPGRDGRGRVRQGPRLRPHRPSYLYGPEERHVRRGFLLELQGRLLRGHQQDRLRDHPQQRPAVHQGVHLRPTKRWCT